MPTYIYACKKCSHTFERIQKMVDKPVKTCPQCGARVERLITGGGGVLFRGAGFYSTDYRSERYKAEEKKETEGAGENKESPAKPGKGKGDRSE